MNRKTKISLLAGVVCAVGGTIAHAQNTTVTNTFIVNQVIPDGQQFGLFDTRTLDFTGLNLNQIIDIKVTLNITGGRNGDYFADIFNSGSTLAILFNRPGRTAGNSDGYADSGFDITLADNAANGDVHTYQNVSNPGGGTLTGVWAPDGRNTDPNTALDTEPRTLTLGQFVGTDPSTSYSLFLDDVNLNGSAGTLVSWGLIITAVPEPSAAALALLGLGGLYATGRFFRRDR